MKQETKDNSTYIPQIKTEPSLLPSVQPLSQDDFYAFNEDQVDDPQGLTNTHFQQAMNKPSNSTQTMKPRKLNPFTLDNSGKLSKLCSTAFKSIHLSSSSKPANTLATGGSRLSTESQTALFLSQLVIKVQTGQLDRDLVQDQLRVFAAEMDVAVEVLQDLMIQLTKEELVRDNIERVVCQQGKGSKGVSQREIHEIMGIARKKKVEEDKQFNMTTHAEMVAGLPQCEQEDIFIDDELEMRAPVITEQIKKRMASMAKGMVKEEPDEMGIDHQEDSTRISNNYYPHQLVKQEKGEQIQASNQKGIAKPAKIKDREIHNELPEGIEELDILKNIHIPVKQNLQSVIETDDKKNKIHAQTKIKTDQKVETTIQPYIKDEDFIYDFENIEGIDFCQHPLAGEFLLQQMQNFVSLEDSCHINSVQSANKIASMSASSIKNPRLKIEKLVVLQVLIQTKNKTILKSFLCNGGLQSIHDWLEYLIIKRIEANKVMSKLEEQIMQRILIVLSRLPLTVEMLKEVKVGKLVNIVRLHQNSIELFQQLAQQLVNQWKQLLIEYKTQRTQQQNIQQQLMQIQQFQMALQTMPPPPTSNPSENPKEVGQSEYQQLKSEIEREEIEKLKNARRDQFLKIFREIKTQGLLNERDYNQQKQQEVNTYQEENQDIEMTDHQKSNNQNQSMVDKVGEIGKSDEVYPKLIVRFPGKMSPLLSPSYTQDYFVKVFQSVKNQPSHVSSQEQANQKERERYVQAQTNPHMMDNPVFMDLKQAETEQKPICQCDLEQASIFMKDFQEKDAKTYQILSKIHQILESDPDSIIENKDMFIQILEGINQETIAYIFKAPKFGKQQKSKGNLPGELPSRIAQNKILEDNVQKLLYKTIMCHYLQCNPILGNYISKEISFASEKEKEQFYKQAKEFFIKNPCKSPTPQKQYLQNLQDGKNLDELKKQETGQNVQIQQVLDCGGQQKVDQSTNNQTTPFLKSPQLQQTQLGQQSQQQLPQMQQQPFNLTSQMAISDIQYPQQTIAGTQYFGLNQATDLTNAASSMVGFQNLNQSNVNDSHYQFQQMLQLQNPSVAYSQTNPLSSYLQMPTMNPFFMSMQIQKPKNYRTVPCRLYHGFQGCLRGDTCHFIHDPNYKGVEIPREVLLQIRHDNLQKFQTGQLSGIPVFQPGQAPPNPLTQMQQALQLQQQQLQQNFFLPSNPPLKQDPYSMQESNTQQFSDFLQPALPQDQQNRQAATHSDTANIHSPKNPNNNSDINHKQPSSNEQHTQPNQEQQPAAALEQQQQLYMNLLTAPPLPTPQPSTKPASPPKPDQNYTPITTASTTMLHQQQHQHADISSSANPPSSIMTNNNPTQCQQQQQQQQYLLQHPYFNPQFSQQYYLQQEAYKAQQQAQIIANLNNQNNTLNDTTITGGGNNTTARNVKNDNIVGMAQDDDDGMDCAANDTALKSSILFTNLGFMTSSQPSAPSNNVSSLSQHQSQLGKTGEDYTMKLIQDKKTQEVHRKLLEQIKLDKEKRKEKFQEKYNRKVQQHLANIQLQEGEGVSHAAQLSASASGLQNSVNHTSAQNNQIGDGKIMKMQKMEVEQSEQKGAVSGKVKRAPSRSRSRSGSGEIDKNTASGDRKKLVFDMHSGNSVQQQEYQQWIKKGDSEDGWPDEQERPHNRYQRQRQTDNRDEREFSKDKSNQRQAEFFDHQPRSKYEQRMEYEQSSVYRTKDQRQTGGQPYEKKRYSNGQRQFEFGGRERERDRDIVNDQYESQRQYTDANYNKGSNEKNRNKWNENNNQPSWTNQQYQRSHQQDRHSNTNQRRKIDHSNSPSRRDTNAYRPQRGNIPNKKREQDQNQHPQKKYHQQNPNHKSRYGGYSNQSKH